MTTVHEVHTVYCPRCDRPYSNLDPAKAVDLAREHVDGQHPDMINPFREED